MTEKGHLCCSYIAATWYCLVTVRLGYVALLANFPLEFCSSLSASRIWGWDLIKFVGDLLWLTIKTWQFIHSTEWRGTISISWSWMSPCIGTLQYVRIFEILFLHAKYDVYFTSCLASFADIVLLRVGSSRNLLLLLLLGICRCWIFVPRWFTILSLWIRWIEDVEILRSGNPRPLLLTTVFRIRKTLAIARDHRPATLANTFDSQLFMGILLTIWKADIIDCRIFTFYSIWLFKNLLLIFLCWFDYISSLFIGHCGHFILAAHRRHRCTSRKRR